MYARIDSVQSTGHPKLDPRLVGGGLAAALVIGVVAGFAAATLNTHAPSTVAGHAPAATVNAPSTGVYGDRDSRLPIATVPAGSLNDRNVGRNLVPNSVMSELDRAHAARVAALQAMSGVDWNAAGDVYGLRDSRPPLALFQLP